MAGIFGGPRSDRALPMRVQGSDSLVVVYHRTSTPALERILGGGFHDSLGWRDASGVLRRGVWLSSLPIDDAPFNRDIVVALHVPEDLLPHHQLQESQLDLTVWCVPAVELNARARISHQWASPPNLGWWPGRPPSA